jgi:hypothetical protein
VGRDTYTVSTVILSQTDPWDIADVTRNESGKRSWSVLYGLEVLSSDR